MLWLLLACGPLRTATEEVASTSRYDVIIQHGKIVDGTGSPWFYGDVALRGEDIARVAPPGVLDTRMAERVIDAEGMVVAPGFIDLLSHSHRSFLTGDTRVVSKVTQGITTEILGESTTYAPVHEAMLSDLSEEQRQWRLEQFGGPNGFDNWLSYMGERGASVNIGARVGATTIRRYAMGMQEGAAGEAELDTMRTLVRRAMEDGALGLSSALIYPPASYVDTDELVALASEMAPYGGVYVSHIRSEGDELLSAIEEAIEIGRRAGVPVEILHLKAAGQRNWNDAARSFALIEEARREGLDVEADMYPYEAAGTGLTACLPPWASADGQLMENLRDPTTRAEIREAMLEEQGDWENFCQLARPEGVMILGVQESENEPYRGERLATIADERNQHWTDAALDLIESEGNRVSTIYFLMSPENVRKTMQQPWIKFGTDAGGRDPETATGLTHPRAYGTYPRILGRFVRDDGVLSLEEAIRKMTSAAANRFTIQDRGVLREEMKADVVIFDPDEIIDRATFEDPHQLSVGMRYVFVNGKLVVQEGEHTGARPGQIIRGPGYTPASR